MNTKIKKWFFKTCPKSGRIVGINKKSFRFGKRTYKLYCERFEMQTT